MTATVAVVLAISLLSNVALAASTVTWKHRADARPKARPPGARWVYDQDPTAFPVIVSGGFGSLAWRADSADMLPKLGCYCWTACPVV